MVTVFLRRPTNFETNSISYYRCTFTGPADQVERAKEAFQFQIDLVRAGKTTTIPRFYQLFQQTILDMDFLGMIKDHDEEQRKKSRDDFLQTFPIWLFPTNVLDAFFSVFGKDKYSFNTANK